MSKSIKKNYIYNVIYQVLVIIIPIITTPYISRVLLPEGVGKYSFTYSLITYFTIFASLGFGYYAQREIAKFQEDKERQSIIFWEIIICRLLSVGLSLLLNFVLIVFGVYGNYSLLMLVLSINIFATGVDIGFYFQGNENFGILVIKNLLVRVLGIIFIFLFVKKPEHVWIYALINSCMVIFGNLLMWLSLKNKLCKIKLNEIKPFRHLKGTLKLFIPTLATSLYVVLDKSLIGFITGSDVENGFYEQAEKIVKIALTVITCLGSVMIPRNSHEAEIGNFDKVKDNIYKTFHFLWVIGIPLMIGLCLISSNLIPWFLGEDFNGSILLMQLLSTLVISIGMSNIIGLQYLIPMKKDKWFTISITTGAIVNLCLNIPLIFLLKSLGAAIATIIAELMVTVIMIYFTRKELSLKMILATTVKPIIATVIMCLALIPLVIKLSSSIFSTMLIAVIGVMVYLIILIILKEEYVCYFINIIKNQLFKGRKKETSN